MAFKHRNMFYQNKKQETTEIVRQPRNRHQRPATTAISTATASTLSTSFTTAHNPLALSPRTTTPSPASAGMRSKPTATTSASATARPPPIHVAEVHEIVIAPSTPGAGAIIRYLAGNNFSYHTYQLRSERSYRVVMRGLNHLAPEGRIRTDIENQGHQQGVLLGGKRRRLVPYKGCQVYKELQERSRPGQPRRDVLSERARPMVAVQTTMHVVDAPPKAHQPPRAPILPPIHMSHVPYIPRRQPLLSLLQQKKATPPKTPPLTQKVGNSPGLNTPPSNYQ
ncbi:hypothetical protein AAG570_012658 [Ranatra chinensis]|uniref:Uncharacterized protein n=1 Tax=Ranatra chinensis TaxID=642074 RepID=A0ABD0YF33_9HEMI